MNRYNVTIISQLEAFFNKYIAFQGAYALPLALWTIGTYLYQDFNVFPYLVITAATKRSGKTLLSNLVGFASNNPMPMGAVTPAVLFHSIAGGRCTILCDEAEPLSSEGASTLRSVLNMGYRKGGMVGRMLNGEVMQYPTFCPKVFVLIGSANDTLTDRSIIIRMVRTEAPARFNYDTAQLEGEALRAEIQALVKTGAGSLVVDSYLDHAPLEFLTNARDEELWLPLFAIAKEFCPERLAELQAAAVDIATEKTAAARRYINLQGAERDAEDDEYGLRLLADTHAVLKAHSHKSMSTKELIQALYAVPTSPWRKFRGPGLSSRNLSDMLSRHGVTPRPVRNGSAVARGYRFQDVDAAVKKL